MMYSGKGYAMAEFQDVAAAFGKQQIALEMNAAIKQSLAKVLKKVSSKLQKLNQFLKVIN